jgi:hypothetical protein
VHIPSAPPPYTGACLCGLVQFELTRLPWTYYACHCTDCQRRTGSSMRLAMWVNRDALVIRQGTCELRSFEFGGRQRRLNICATCNTHLWSEPESRPELAVLLASTLHQHRDFAPVAHIWTKSALPWVAFPPGVATYETQPKDATELVRLWREKTRGNSGAT